MPTLQSVQSALQQIDPVGFQELCDMFLLRTNKRLRSFGRPGSQEAKKKTTKGTPDTYFELDNGNYVFVEYSTNTTEGIKKLKEDILKCIDETKTKISVEKIDEIILCFNFDITPSELEDLKSLLSHLPHIKLIDIQLSHLSGLLKLEHKDLAHQYLGLAFDTEQIVPLESFMTEYNQSSGAIATPIDNPFYHRETELSNIVNTLENGDFVILSGAPGVGKTKLACEALMKFNKSFPDYKIFGVTYRHADLIDDMSEYLLSGEDIILFIDDANRIDRIEQIFGLFTQPRVNKLKIVITVRDYGLETITSRFYGKINAQIIKINKLTTEQITEIIKSPPFGIINTDFQSTINRIANGNPRFSIMCARLALKLQNISGFRDVSDMFEEYFLTFLQDKKILDQKLLIQIGGLVSFFYALPIDKGSVENILQIFSIDYGDFIEGVNQLEKLEIVEIRYDHIKISEQNLASFLFYKAFIADSYLSLEELFLNYYASHTKEMQDSIISANNSFGEEKVKIKLIPILRTSLKNSSDNGHIYKLLMQYWFYLEPEAKEYLVQKIDELPDSATSGQIYQGEIDKREQKDPLLNLIEWFLLYPFDDYGDYISLILGYLKKKPELLPDVVSLLTKSLAFTYEDSFGKFKRQAYLFEFIFAGLDSDDDLIIKLFLSIAGKFLKFRYEKSSYSAPKTITLSWYIIPENSSELNSIRSQIFHFARKLYLDYPKEVFSIFQQYEDQGHNTNQALLKEEINQVVDFIEECLDPTCFDHCLYVYEQIEEYRRNQILDTRFDTLEGQFNEFSFHLYKIFITNTVDGEDLLGKHDYDKLKEEFVRKSIKIQTKEECDKLYDAFCLIQREKNNWNFKKLFDYVVDELFKIDMGLGIYLFRKCIDGNSELDYIPALPFRNQINEQEKFDIFYSLINSKEFPLKGHWRLSLLIEVENVKNLKITQDDILQAFGEIKNKDNNIWLKNLQQYLDNFPDLLSKIIDIMSKKIQEDKLNFYVHDFGDHLEYLLSTGKGEQAMGFYLLQNRILPHFDYKGELLVKILRNNPAFLLEYFRDGYSHMEEHHFRHPEPLGDIWTIDGVEEVIFEILDFVVEKEKYFFGIGEHYINSFFTEIPDEFKKKAENFIFQYIQLNYLDYSKMDLLADLLRNTMSYIYESSILQYLELNQSWDDFDKINWIESSATYSGDVVFGDIQAGKYLNLLSIVKKSKVRAVGIIKIKAKLQQRIDQYKESANYERKRKFIERDIF